MKIERLFSIATEERVNAMGQIQFPDHVMVCNSTGNQTVNLIPAIQFNVGYAIVVSTEFTEKGLTNKLKAAMKKRGIEAKIERISHDEEKNVNLLSEKLVSLTKEHKKTIWNISGGQKIPTVALHNAFYRRIEAGFSDDMVVYVEGNDPAIWYYGKDFSSHSVRSNVDISLEELLDLFSSHIHENSALKIYPGSKESDKKIEVALKALSIYKESDIFREAFFAFMETPMKLPQNKSDLVDQIRAILNKHKPEFVKVRLKKNGYENLENSIGKAIEKIHNSKSLREAKEAIDRLRLITKPAEIYEDYWSSIKRECIEKVLEGFRINKQPLVSRNLSASENARLIEWIKSLGGEVESQDANILYKQDVKKFSIFGGNAELFEWMVAASVVNSIRSDPKVSACVSEVHSKVKTRREDPVNLQNDAEIDVLITTKYGTLIVIEAKTYDFSGDTAKSKESVAYKKSGPFAKAIIVGPLLRSIVTEKDGVLIDAPRYIPDKTKAQPLTALQNGITYWYLDEVDEMLRKQLHV